MESIEYIYLHWNELEISYLFSWASSRFYHKCKPHVDIDIFHRPLFLLAHLFMLALRYHYKQQYFFYLRQEPSLKISRCHFPDSWNIKDEMVCYHLNLFYMDSSLLLTHILDFNVLLRKKLSGPLGYNLHQLQ